MKELLFIIMATAAGFYVGMEYHDQLYPETLKDAAAAGVKK